MGEAARRRNAGLPPRTVRCPVLTCRHRHVLRHGPDSPVSLGMARMWGGTAPTEHYQCARCSTLWEPLPDGWNTDNVERAITLGPCDNCAYRAASPETRDPAKRAELHGHAIEAARTDYATGGPVFACHKGVPIRITIDPPSIEYDFAAAGINPADQPCAGYLRMLWAKNGAAKNRRERLDAAPHEEPPC